MALIADDVASIAAMPTRIGPARPNTGGATTAKAYSWASWIAAASKFPTAMIAIAT